MYKNILEWEDINYLNVFLTIIIHNFLYYYDI